MKWFKQLFCKHDLEWKYPLKKSYWRGIDKYQMEWVKDMYGHECKKCGAIKYKNYIRENGVITY